MTASAPREIDAKRFAEKMGWAWVLSSPDVPDGHPYFWIAHDWSESNPSGRPECLSFPVADAPLHEHLAFVGRIAEALPGWTLSSIDCPNPTDIPIKSLYGVGLVSADGKCYVHTQAAGGDAWHGVDDLSHAAILAALAALESK